MSALKCSQADHQKQASRNCLQCWCPIRAHIVASGDGRHGVTTRSPSGDVAQKEEKVLLFSSPWPGLTVTVGNRRFTGSMVDSPRRMES